MKGRVYKSTGSNYVVKIAINDSIEYVNAVLKGKFRNDNIKHTNPVAVGDYVVVMKDPKGDGYLIDEIQQRDNYIIRKSVNLSKRTQIIASNLDQLLLIVTLADPKTTIGFIDRYLVTAESYHIPVTILFNKSDLYSDADLLEFEQLKKVYSNCGYPTHLISAKNQEQSAAFLKELLNNKTTLLSGNSGVGKTSLINTVAPDLNLRTGELTKGHYKGKHTTTFAEAFDLNNTTTIIDTPGLKSFGIVDYSKEELWHYFPEIRSEAEHCKFHNCIHINEPKCAVLNAVAEGIIAESRYKSYLDLYYEDSTETYRTKDY